MNELNRGVIVGVLGQWASGKTLAAKTLIQHLGGKEEVIFLTDRVLFASQVIDYISTLEESKLLVSVDDDGRRRYKGELAVLWLNPGEQLRSVDPETLDFDIYNDQIMIEWRTNAKVELGNQIRERSKSRKPVVVEAAFGPNTEPDVEYLYGRTIADLFARLENAGADPSQIAWLIISTSFENRFKRNEMRRDKIPPEYFLTYSADGGDFTHEQEKLWAGRGTIIQRIDNNHDDVERFRSEILAAFEDSLRSLASAG